MTDTVEIRIEWELYDRLLRLLKLQVGQTEMQLDHARIKNLTPAVIESLEFYLESLRRDLHNFECGILEYYHVDIGQN